jgi:uncharacterized membrane protein
MIKSPELTVFAKWKRPIIGGLFSDLLVGFTILLNRVFLHQKLLTLEFLFATPGYLIAPKLMGGIWLWGIPFVLLIWFLIGALIARLIKTNIMAIGCWLLVLALIYFSVNMIFWYQCQTNRFLC